jgi:hypothetical protein
LKLRKYLLGDIDCEYLFFSFGGSPLGQPGKMGNSVLREHHKTLRIIDPQVPSVLSREWRAAKSDWLIRNTDIATTAQILNTSVKTVIQHYSAGSETQHCEEVSNYFVHVTETVIARGEVIDNGIDRAVGVCSSYGAPHQIDRNAPVASDCMSPEGCLFCDKFKIHADDRDTRKLISCRYCIQQTTHLASSEEQFQRMFTPIFERIEQLLVEIAHRDEAMVKRIEKEVAEGELDSFWASKLEMLINLELIA